jgi:uncharacterized protein (TIGR03000 family)
MYSVMLAAALTTGTATPDWGWHSSCYGCSGGVYYNAFSCGGCYGCYGCCGGVVAYPVGYGCCGGCCGGYVVPVTYYSYPAPVSYYGCCGGCCGGYVYPVTYGCCGGTVRVGGGSGSMGGGGGMGGATGNTGGSAGWGMKPVPPDGPGMKPGEKPSREQIEMQIRRLREALEMMQKQLEGTKPTKPETDEEVSTPAPARVVVKLPAEAKLFVDGVACPLTSAQRSFDTPPLEPGKTYYYSLKAETNREGRSVAETKRVTVRAGQETIVEFESKPVVATASR